jgi:hypothetical protein
MTFGAPTDPVSSAYFGTTQGKFRMVYPFSEQATVVTGEVVLTRRIHGPEHSLQGRRQLVRDQGHACALGHCQRKLCEALFRGCLTVRAAGSRRQPFGEVDRP